MRQVQVRGVKQLLWRARFERGAARLDVNGHHLTAGRLGHVEELTPIVPPSWKPTSVRRDLPLARSTGKRLDVNLDAARFIRVVREPLPVGGDLPVALAERSMEQWQWVPVARQRRHPHD